GTMMQDRVSVRNEQALIGITLAEMMFWQKAVHRTAATWHRGSEPPSPAHISGNREGIEGPIRFRTHPSMNTPGKYPSHGWGRATSSLRSGRHLPRNPALVRSRQVFRSTPERREARKVPTVEGSHRGRAWHDQAVRRAARQGGAGRA